MKTEGKSFPLRWLSSGLWFVEGAAITLSWVFTSLGVSATIVAANPALLVYKAQILIPTIAVLALTIWRRGMARWAGGTGIPLGLFSAVFMWGMTILLYLNGADLPSSFVGVLAGLLGLGLFGLCAWYQPESLHRWKADTRDFMDGKDAFLRADCFDEGVAPTFFLAAAIFFLNCLRDPSLVVRFLEYDHQYFVEALKAQHSDLVLGPAVPPSISLIRGIAAMATIGFALAIYVAIRRRGHGRAALGSGVWLVALGQAAGFVLGPIALITGVSKLAGSSWITPDGWWLFLAVGILASVIGLVCYRVRRKWRPGSSADPIPAG